MIADVAQCLSRQELTDFASGRVAVERFDEIAMHVDACSSCQSSVLELSERSDTFIERLRALPADDPLEQEDACRAVVERLAKRSASGREGRRIPTAPFEAPATIGSYRILEPLGAGGMGMVYKARHEKLKRTVAVKLLPVQRWVGPAAVARFQREMEIIGGLDHPNIVSASDAGEEDGMHYLVMEHVDGLDLSRLVRRVGPLPVPEACEIVRQAAEGLAYVHDAKLVHRDIKPSNLMLTRDGTVKILDLGLAMLGEQYLEGENNLTTIGQLMGTLDYMAPEQAADSHTVDIRADIYSLGATLYKLLTGHAPFSGAPYNTLLKKALALASDPVPPVQESRPELPAELAEVVHRMLARDPNERLSSPEEVVAALKPFTADADLVALSEQAATADARDEPGAPAWLLPAGHDVASARRELKPVAPNGRSQWRRRLTVAIATAVLFVLVIAGGFVVRLATDRGELIIQSNDPGAHVLIKKDGKPVKDMTLSHGKRAITVRSGEYTIELHQSNADRFMLSKNRFTISRGETIVLEVHQRPTEEHLVAPGMMSGAYGSVAKDGYGDMMESGASDMSDMDGGMGMEGDMEMSAGMEDMGHGMAMGMGMPGGYDMEATKKDVGKPRLVYDGRRYSEWLRILETERKPERLIDALTAVKVLGPEAGSEEAARAVLHVMRAFGSTSHDNSPEGKLIESAYQTLGRMHPPAVAKASVSEIREGNDRSRDFLTLFLGTIMQSTAYGDTTRNRVTERWAGALKEVAPEVMPLLVSMSRGSDASIRQWSLDFGASFVGAVDIEAAEAEDFCDRLVEALRDTDRGTVLTAARSLSDLLPNTEGLAETLASFIGDSDTMRQITAIRALGHMGPRAAPAVPELAEALRALPLEESVFGPIGVRYGSTGHLAQHIIQTLKSIGPAAKAAIPALNRFASKENMYQDAAKRAIAKIVEDPDDGH